MSRFRSALALLGPFVLLASSSGCEMGHQYFHMDSNSPTPFFGFDLLPRRSTSMKQRAEDQKLIQLATDGDRALEYAKVR